MSTRKPAAARSSSDSPPQKPYSRVLARPAAARVDDLAAHADRSGPGFAQKSGLRALARRGEEQFGLTSARCVARPGQRAGEQQAGDGIDRHLRSSRVGEIVVRQCDDGWPVGGTRPPPALRPPWLPIGFNLSNKQLRWKPSLLKMDQGHERPRSRRRRSSRCRRPTSPGRGGPVELRHLDAVLAVADEGSFTAAADALSTVQSNVSEQIRQLEAELGAELFVRSRRGAEPTDCGEVVLERARRIRRELESLRADLSMLQGLEVGDASFGVVGTASRWLVPELVADLRKRAPGIHLRIVEGASERLVGRGARRRSHPGDRHRAGRRPAARGGDRPRGGARRCGARRSARCRAAQCRSRR